jgi:hypothetical protein
MSDSANKGIATNPIIHKFASAKGGRVKTKKGLAKLSPERRGEIASLGGKAKNENRNTRSDSSAEE